MRDFLSEEAAKVLFAAILLGDQTLKKHLKSIESFEKDKLDETSQMLADFLNLYAGFDEVYAKFLSENLSLMNESSVRFISTKMKDSEAHVRFSFATHFQSDKDYSRFDTLMKIYKTRVPVEK